MKKKKSAKAAPKKPSQSLLQKGEPKAYALVNPRGAQPVLIVCDHASNAMPKAVKNLGLTAAQRRQHIAWDPGTATIGRYLSRKIDARLVLANYSRLVVDLNRGERHKDCMRASSEGVAIPGNKNLTATEKKSRLTEIYWAYHDEITRQIDAILASGRVPLILSIHSFTPAMNGQHRPWHIGIMWNRQEKLSKKLVASLKRRNPALSIGENQPYSLKGAFGGRNTIQRHAEDRGLPYLIVEFRQDLVGGTKREAEDWGRVFLESLQPIINDAATYRRQRR